MIFKRITLLMVIMVLLPILALSSTIPNQQDSIKGSLVSNMNFWHSIRILDFDHPSVINGNFEQKKYTTAIKNLINGNFREAENNFYFLIRHSSDSLILYNSFEVLGNLLYMQSKWSEMKNLFNEKQIEMDSTDLSTFKLLTSFCQSPAEGLIFRKNSFTIPFKLKHADRHPYIKVLVNGNKEKFVLDTGAGISVISSSLAKKIGVKPIGEKGFAESASMKEVAIKPGIIDSIRIGELVIYNHPVAIVKDEDMEFKLFGIKIIDIEGIIGWPIMQKLNVEMNYKTEIMTINKPIKIDNPNKNLFWYGTPMVFAINFVTKQKIFFELDFGGSTSNIYNDIVEKLPDTTIIKKETRQFGSAGGFIDYDAIIINGLGLNVGHKNIFFKEIRSRPSSKKGKAIISDGVLGGDIVEGRIVKFDFSNGIFEILDLE